MCGSIYGRWIEGSYATFTTDPSFISVIEDAVDRYAFYSSDYPLVLSIENHCKKAQRDVMAQILVKILGNKLHRDPVDPKLKSMPSPESLKNKILIKDKKVHSVSKPTAVGCYYCEFFISI